MTHALLADYLLQSEPVRMHGGNRMLKKDRDDYLSLSEDAKEIQRKYPAF